MAEDEIDLFTTPDLIPKEVKVLMDIWYKEVEINCGDKYKACEVLIEGLKPLGYTCDYGLDGEPFDLQKIN